MADSAGRQLFLALVGLQRLRADLFAEAAESDEKTEEVKTQSSGDPAAADKPMRDDREEITGLS